MPSVGRSVRQIPVARLLAAAELLLLARQHVTKLDPHERRRIVELIRRGHGRPRNLTERERRELSRLMAKAEPRLFVTVAANRLAGVSLPGTGTRGRAGAKHD
jgi:hypothetical protein